MPAFRLATLLKLRIDERDFRRREFAQAQEAQQLLEEQKQTLTDEHLALQSLATQQVQPGVANMDSLLQLNRYQVQLLSQRRTLEGQIAQVAAEAERRRGVLVESDRQVRVLEKLREKQAEEATTRELQREIKDFDEASIIAFRQQQEARP